MTEKAAKNGVHYKYYTLKTSQGIVKISDVGITNLFQRCLDLNGTISFVYTLDETPKKTGMVFNESSLKYNGLVSHSDVKKRTYLAAVSVEGNPFWFFKSAFVFVNGVQVI